MSGNSTGFIKHFYEFYFSRNETLKIVYYLQKLKIHTQTNDFNFNCDWHVFKIIELIKKIRRKLQFNFVLNTAIDLPRDFRFSESFNFLISVFTACSGTASLFQTFIFIFKFSWSMWVTLLQTFLYRKISF